MKKLFYRGMVYWLVVILLFSLAFSNVQTVYAVSPQVTVSPLGGAAGASIQVTGSGFSPNLSGGEVYFDTNLNGQRDVDEPANTSVTTDTNGALSVTLQVPSTPPGYYPIRIVFSSQVVATAFFIIRQPTISVGVNKGAPGTSIIIKGSNFASNSSGWIWFDTDKDFVRDLEAPPKPAEPAMFVTTDAAGDFIGFLNVPNADLGVYPVIADLPDDGKNDSWTTFTVEPSVTLIPTSGPADTVLSITGSGFQSGPPADPFNYLVWLDINDNNFADSNEPQILATCIDGKIATSLTVPKIPPGSYPVKISLNSTVKGKANFIVEGPGLLVNPSKAKPGTLITVEGSRFPENAKGHVWFDTNGNNARDPNEIDKSVTTNGFGIFSTTLTIPSVQAGVYYNIIADFPDGTNRGVAPVMVLASPSLSLNVTSGSPDTTIIVNGKDFAPWTSTLVWFDLNGNGKKDYNEPARTVKTDGLGRFRAILTVPHNIKPGAYVIYASAPTWTSPQAYADFFVSTSQAKGAPTPEVTSSIPHDGAENVYRYPTIKLTFNTPIVTGPDFAAIFISDQDGNDTRQKASIKGRVLQIKPIGVLKELNTYVLFIPAQAILNTKGVGMEEDYFLSFTTLTYKKGATITLQSSH